MAIWPLKTTTVEIHSSTRRIIDIFSQEKTKVSCEENVQYIYNFRKLNKQVQSYINTSVFNILASFSACFHYVLQ